MKRNWSWGTRHWDDEPGLWLIIVCAIAIFAVFSIIDSWSGQPDIGAEPRSDVVWSERELER